jgi:hypothetical protein
MIKAARPIIDYVYEKLKKESEELEVIENDLAANTDTDFKPQQITIFNFNKNETFVAPKVTPKVITTVKISYSKEKVDVEAVKERLNVGTYKEVGEKTFDYYLSMEM